MAEMMKQPIFKGFERPKRSSPRIMAKMIDAGGEGEPMVHYVCKKCGWDSGWVVDHRSTLAIISGIPCETCNGKAQ